MFARARRRRRRAGVAALLLVIASLILTVRDSPVAVSPPTGVRATDAASCAVLTRRLPDVVDGRRSRTVTPASTLTAAWGRPAITLRCGQPPAARPVSAAEVSFPVAGGSVAWFQDPFDETLWQTRIRPILAVHVPAADGLAGVLVPISAAVAAAADR